MDSLCISTGITSNKLSGLQLFSKPFSYAKKSRTLSFRRKPRKILVSATKDGPQFDEWDQMELKFGRMIGEDPKVTLAKIMGRKSNPDMSYLEIEKLIEKKGKVSNDQIQEVPFDPSDWKISTKSVQGLNLVRPVPKKGTKFETKEKPVKTEAKSTINPAVKPTRESKSNVPNVILRKPSSFDENNSRSGKSTRITMKPNLSLTMGKEQQKERFSDITLLKKPEPVSISPGDDEVNDPSDSGNGKTGVIDDLGNRSNNATLLQKPDLLNLNLGEEGEWETFEEHNESGLGNTKSNLYQSLETMTTDSRLDEGLATELQGDVSSGGRKIDSDGPSRNTPEKSVDTVLIQKPKRLDFSSKATDQRVQEAAVPLNPESLGNLLELEKFLATSPIKEHENDDWGRAEKLVKTGERDEVELISSSTRGFVVSFGSLIGFLPYRNLAARWKFLAFESWLRRKGLDPSLYRQNLGVIGKYDANSMTDLSEPGTDTEIDNKAEGNLSPDMKLEELLMIYDQEKLKFLSSFVGQKIKVGVVLADRNSRRLIFSIKPKEKEELAEKKRSLMAQLSVGDVVKCCIKKITYFGIFVEVEGVPALIHQTEVSWDATLDPASYFKVGQIVEAKVHQLDFSLERIFLSLKEITPDPLIEALEAVVGDNDSLGGELEVAQADTEWPDVESLIKELQQFDGIQSVSKGRYFLSPGLAPIFQVYMASMYENQYKLLARAGNRVQEVIVQTSLGKEEMKTAILTCTNRVE